MNGENTKVWSKWDLMESHEKPTGPVAISAGSLPRRHSHLANDVNNNNYYNYTHNHFALVINNQC